MPFLFSNSSPSSPSYTSYTTRHLRGWWSRRLPVAGQQCVEVVAGGHARQLCEDITEVKVRIDTVALAGDDDGVDDRRALSGVGVADEEPVFLSDGGGADGVFDEVVVESHRAVCGDGGERGPLREHVGAGESEHGLGVSARPGAS